MSAQFFEDRFAVDSFTDSDSQRFVNREGFLNKPPLLAISIQDDGPGIPPDVLAKMFETKFTTKAPGKGTGLGLGIVKRLVRAGQGAIHLETEIGRGSTFTVCLPSEESDGLE